jgi:hypothetical protein
MTPTLIEKKTTPGYKQFNQKAINIPMTISEEEELHEELDQHFLR